MTAPLAFVDTETTGLDPTRHEVWEVFLVLRYPAEGDDQPIEVRKHWFLPVDLAKADPVALTIGRYYERVTEPVRQYDRDDNPIDPRFVFAHEFARLTHGAHLVGAVPSFDEAFLRRLLAANGACLGTHYHLVDVEALAIGFLAGLTANGAMDSAGGFDPPWNSSNLTAALGLTIDESTKHTAEGDVRWAMAIYDTVMGSAR